MMRYGSSKKEKSCIAKQLKLNAKTSQEIIEVLENSQQNLKHLQSEYFIHQMLIVVAIFMQKVQTITSKRLGKKIDIEKDKKNFIPAEIRIKIWFGLSIHEQD
ncbi:unnamed protein product [Rotaria sordida]|uniref:Uncharacterized protein n=1 Tax=Rotaria sordida TaxID=392033 RepID=A0A819U7S5_9BILA|nr:unnamed protein product [Rotaria sordida]